MLAIIPQESLIWDFVDQNNLFKQLKFGGGSGLPALQLPPELTGISSRMGSSSVHVRAGTKLTSEFRRLIVMEGQLEGVGIRIGLTLWHLYGVVYFHTA